MRVRLRKGSWIIVPVLILSFFSTPAQAQAQPGLSATVYNNYGYNASPPLPTVSGRPVQCTTTYLSINQNFGNNICGLYDDFIVKYEGYITSPTTETYTLYMHGDDGVKLYLDDVLKVNAWYDSGNAGATAQVSFVAGVPQKLLAWYYENGGGNWVKLEYLVNGSWTPVPDSWFTQTNEPTNTTTTTLSPYFNEVQNLTAIANEDGSVNLAWDAPAASNTEIYGYSINFVDFDDNVERGGWGIWTLAANTSYSLGHWMFDGSNPVTTGYGQVRFKVYAMSGPCAGVGSGSCLYGPSTNVDTTVLDPTPPTTTTSSSTTTTSSTSTTSTSLEPTTTTSTTIVSPINNTTTTEPETTTTIESEPTTTEPEAVETPTVTTTTEVETVETPASTDNPKDDEPATPVPQHAAEDEAPATPEVEVSKDTQDAADAAVADIFDSPISDAKLADAVDGLIADAGTPEELTAVVTALLDQELTDTQFATVIDSVFSEPLSDENFSAAVDAVFADTSALSDEQFDTAVQAVFDGPLSTEQFSAALEAVFDEPISDEKFDAIINAVLDEPLSDEQFAELVGVLESDTVTEEQVAAAVDSVIENGVTEDQATELATSKKVLQSIDGEQATEIFDAVDIGAVTPEEAAALVEAVQDAPTEVREALESEINVFDGAIDTYVPLGSAVDVGVRRVIIAATAVLSITAVPTAPPAGPSGGGSGGGSGGDTDGNPSDSRRRRK